jgi:predicted class III extradiol MEMO1 family dioxygenase
VNSIGTTGETTGEVQQQQGNANRASVAGRCPTPIGVISVDNDLLRTLGQIRKWVNQKKINV